MARQYHRCNGQELGQTSGDSEGQGGQACCSPGGHKVRHDWATKRQCIYMYVRMYFIWYACTLCLTHIHFYLVKAYLYLEYTSINTYKANAIIFLCLRISSLILSLLASTLANTLIRKWGRQKKMGRKRRLFSMWLETNINLILQGGLELSLPFSFVPN